MGRKPWLLVTVMTVVAVIIAGWTWFSKGAVIYSDLSAQVSRTVFRHVSRAGFPFPSVPEWTLLTTGDVIPARTANYQMTKRRDFTWPFKNIATILQEADITLINLEAPLLTNCPVTTEGMKFCGDARFARVLSESGIDVVNLANNHSLNYGWEGIQETETHLEKVGIETTGFTITPTVISNGVRDLATEGSASLDFSDTPRNDTKICEKDTYCSKFIAREVKGISLGFLGYNAVGQRLDREVTEQQIRDADSKVDVLIVSVHWGKEYVREPVSDPGIAPDDPQELGKLFVDWGADVVVGNHPHWYQSIEWYRDKPIFYALGNTVFDQEWSRETKVGFLAKLYFNGTQVSRNRLEIFPIGLRNYGEAYLLEEEEKETVLDYLKNP